MKTIILAGGTGTRLWPLSRTYYPKQFLKLKGMEYSMFQLTYQRALMLGGPDDIYIVTNRDYQFLILGQIAELGVIPNESRILLEPQARNTLPAIYYAVWEMRKHGEDRVVVFPSDHIINRSQEFMASINNVQALADQYIITFGIMPTGPETGYGYIQPGEPLSYGFKAKSFREKPDRQTAKTYIDAGYLWNSGMFLFNTELFAREIGEYAPQIVQAFDKENSIESCFENIKPLSIDYGIMEKSDRVAVLPFDIEWNDMGGFAAFYDNYNENKDENGNITFGNEILVNAGNNVVYTDADKAVGVIGVKDLVIIDQKDALLVCHKDETPKVKEIVERLKSKGDSRAEYHITCYQPWGSYTMLEGGDYYKIIRLTVRPEMRLQYHIHSLQNLHWIVVHGTAKVAVNGEDHRIISGQGIDVPVGAKARLENPDAMLLEVIEIQIGRVLDDDTIRRDTVNK